MKPLRPYLYHAYYQWIIDNDLTPYLLVDSTYPGVDVPSEYVRDGRIILNIAPRSIGQYQVDSHEIRFNARFSGIPRELCVPFGAMVAIYSQEHGDGVMFQVEACYEETDHRPAETETEKPSPQSVRKKSGHLKLIK